MKLYFSSVKNDQVLVFNNSKITYFRSSLKDNLCTFILLEFMVCVGGNAALVFSLKGSPKSKN